jgi:hypothetical protein
MDNEMGRKRNPDKKTTEEIVREALEKEQTEFRSARQSNFEAPADSQQDARAAFSAFWAMAKKDYKRTKDLEDILWAHLKASGHDKPELFEKGLEHFGLKK